MRLRKAWEVRLRGFDYGLGQMGNCLYAPTAGKARYSGLLSIRDCYPEISFADVLVKRWPERDVKLPDEDPSIANLTERERHTLLHAYGASHGPYKAGFRDYFYGQEDAPDLLTLVDRGLMTGPHQPWGREQHGSLAYFYLTDAGKHAAASIVPVYAHD